MVHLIGTLDRPSSGAMRIDRLDMTAVDRGCRGQVRASSEY
jgi:hypothetical protein